MLARIRHWRDAFYRGPRDLGITLPRRRGYQSPTLTFLLWAHALTHRHITYAGRVLLLLASFLVPFGMISLLMPVHLFAFALVMLFAVDLVVGWGVRPRLRVARFLPASVRAGQPVRVEYELRNVGRLPCFDVAVDTLPWPRGFSFIGGTALARSLASGESVRLGAWVRAARRGVYTVPAVRADSAFPFHLWRWGRTGDEPPATLHVHPAFTPLRALPLPGDGRRQSGEAGRTSAGGQAHEFVGCREFRPGDSIRRLHWLSWARVGYPVVKEFRDYFQVDVTLLLDTWRPRRWAWWRRRLPVPEHDPVFEAGLALAAAVGDFLLRERAVVRLHAGTTAAGRALAGLDVAGVEERGRMLDRLACLLPEDHDQFAAACREWLRLGPAPGCVWLVLLNWNPARRQLVEWLVGHGIAVRGVHIRRSLAAAAADPAPGNGLLSVAAADILAGRLREIAVPGGVADASGGRTGGWLSARTR